jgi:hypothetical protein
MEDRPVKINSIFVAEKLHLVDVYEWITEKEIWMKPSVLVCSSQFHCQD